MPWPGCFTPGKETWHPLYERLGGRGQSKCDGTRAETRFPPSAKRTSPFKSPGASVQSTIGSRGVRISGSNAGDTLFRGSVKGTGYPLHSPVSPSLPLPRVTVCHCISTGVYHNRCGRVWNMSFPPGFDPRTVHSVANRYTHCHVPAHLYVNMTLNTNDRHND